MECGCCGEALGTIDLYHDLPVAPEMVCRGCYEDMASENKSLTPLKLHPDYDGEGW